MKTEQAIYTEQQVTELIAKAIKQDREFHAQVLRSLPLPTSDVRQGWIENPKSLQNTLLQALCPPDTETEAESSSLRNLGITITLPAQPECTVANCFTDKKVFAYRDSDFDNWLPATLLASVEVAVSGYELTQTTTEETLAKIGKPFTNLLQIENLIVRTEKGEKTRLIKNGYANIFFLQVGSSVFTVRADRNSDGWDVGLDHFEAGYEWIGENRFFSSAT